MRRRKPPPRLSAKIGDAPRFPGEQGEGTQAVATVPGKHSHSDPNLRDRLYELLEHDHLPYSVGSRFVRLIVAIIILDVLAMIFASEPEIDAQFGALFTAKIGRAHI